MAKVYIDDLLKRKSMDNNTSESNTLWHSSRKHC